MEYIQGISTQTTLFLYSLALGFVLGILYDVFRTLRMFVSGVHSFIVAADVLYFTLCGVISFFFVLVTDEGKLRIYTVLGIMLGWCIWYFSFGVIAMKVSNAIVKGIKRLITLIFRPIKFLSRKITRTAGKIPSFFKKRTRKSIKKSKFILQKRKGIVYNLYGYIYKYKFFNKIINKKGNKDECS
ncbi:MAG: spore cortex biosynthesis protein YabQ [Clostridia bacterium]|nr:spore cortex biosynthesis protein YabQ [Clostridia bacterium]